VRRKPFFIPAKHGEQTLISLGVKFLLYAKMNILTNHKYTMLGSLMKIFRNKYGV